MELPAVAAAPRPEHPFFKADPARPGRGIGRPVERRSARRSERQRVEGRVGRGEPGLHALAFEQAERLRALAIVDRLPEAGAVHIDLAHAGFVQARQRDHMGAVGRRLGERRGGEQLREIAATGALVQLTAMSVEGVNGDRAQNTARWILENGVATVIASDSHSPTRWRPPTMRGAYHVIRRDYGVTLARSLCIANPRAIALSQPLP